MLAFSLSSTIPFKEIYTILNNCHILTGQIYYSYPWRHLPTRLSLSLKLVLWCSINSSFKAATI